MSTYRAGAHHGVTICAEGDGHTCGRPDHDCARGHLVAVIVNGDWALAERIARLLNGDGCTRVGLHNCAGEWRNHDHEQSTEAARGPLRSTETAQAPPGGGSGGPGGAAAISAAPDVIHLIRDGSPTTTCCSRAPFELAYRDGHRLTVEPDAATCPGRPERKADQPCGHVNGFMRELGDPERTRCALPDGHAHPHANKYGKEV